MWNKIEEKWRRSHFFFFFSFCLRCGFCILVVVGAIGAHECNEQVNWWKNASKIGLRELSTRCCQPMDEYQIFMHTCALNSMPPHPLNLCGRRARMRHHFCLHSFRMSNEFQYLNLFVLICWNLSIYEPRRHWRVQTSSHCSDSCPFTIRKVKIYVLCLRAFD